MGKKIHIGAAVSPLEHGLITYKQIHC